MGVICGCIMLATIVFVVGLLRRCSTRSAAGRHRQVRAQRRHPPRRGRFAISWIAFVVGGILCGIVWMIGSVVSKTQEDWIASAPGGRLGEVRAAR